MDIPSPLCMQKVCFLCQKVGLNIFFNIIEVIFKENYVILHLLLFKISKTKERKTPFSELVLYIDTRKRLKIIHYLKLTLNKTKWEKKSFQSLLVC